MALDEITVAVVDFHAAWGDKAANLKAIARWTAEAAGRGAQLVLFPETALSGYNTADGDPAMHRENAVEAGGPEFAELVALAAAHRVYLAVGLPERDAASGAIYNSALVAGPDGLVGCYRKLHPAAGETAWAAKGSEPMLFASPWGPIGLAICYDIYQFPEITRYYCAMGARLVLNATAMPRFSGWDDYYYNQLRARVIENGCFLASGNLVGEDRDVTFPGCSVILGPAARGLVGTTVYAGPVEGEPGLRIATLDLAATAAARRRLPLFTDNPTTGEPDWRPALYADLLERVQRSRS